MNVTVKWSLLWVSLLLVSLMIVIPVHAQDTITIKGRLENGTTNVQVPEGVIVSLNIFRLGENLDTKETRIDTEGSFSFSDVIGDYGYGYIISTDYSGTIYSFESDYPFPEEPIEIMVYESTSSSDKIKVKSHTLLVNGADADMRFIEVMELVGLENLGDRTFLPDISQAGQMDMLRFSLPPTAKDLDVQSSLRGGQILQVDLGFAMTTAVPPGSHEIAYTYLSAYANDKLAFTHSLPFGADIFRVLLIQDLGQVTAIGLQEMSDLALGERNYQHLAARDLNKGTKITVELSDLPEPSLWESWKGNVSWEGIVGLGIPAASGIALIILLTSTILRSKIRPNTSGYSQSSYTSLTEAIAHLDDRFDKRDIEKQEYLQVRQYMKNQILNWREQFQFDDPQYQLRQGTVFSDAPEDDSGQPNP